MSFAISKEKLTYKELRKFLALDEEHIFKGLAYKGALKKAKKERKTNLKSGNLTRLKLKRKSG